MSTPSLAVRRRRGGRGPYKSGNSALQTPVGEGNALKKSKKLPGYLEVPEIAALMKFAPTPVARLCMELQWRAGLRISEAIKVAPGDVNLDAIIPELKVRQGKGHKDRLVPLHTQLANSLDNAVSMWRQRKSDPIIGVTRQRAWTWYKESLKVCNKLGVIPTGKPYATHTLRHSAARHWLLNGVPDQHNFKMARTFTAVDHDGVPRADQ